MDFLNNLQSPSINAVSSALIKAQSEIGVARKDTNGNRYKYATIEQILALIKMPLLKHGLILTQTTIPVNGQTTIITQLTHGETGEFIRGFLPVETPEAIQSKNGNATTNNAQRLGSGITYARRYALVSLFAIPQEDDDGQSYQAQAIQQEQQKQEEETARLAHQERVFNNFLKRIEGVQSVDECHDLTQYFDYLKQNLDQERLDFCLKGLADKRMELTND